MTDNQSPDDATGDAPVKRPTPAASAASRARRIGGVRPSAGVGPTASPVALGKEPSAPVIPANRPPVTELTGSSEPVSTVQVPESGSDGEPTVVTQVPGWFRWVPALVLTICAVVMLVLVAVTAHSVWYAKPSAASLRDQVLAAAKTCVAATNTYQYTDIPKNEAAGAKCTTGRYTSQYMSAMTKIVTPAATKLKATQSVQINAAGVEAISTAGQQWDVVLYGQTTITQASKTKKNASRIDPFALTATMQRVHGKWLISHVGLLTSASG
jgi:hypothetical protein